MYSPAVAHTPDTTPHRSRTRSLGLRTQMMARGPGWRLAEGDAGTWAIKVTREARDAVLTWAHVLQTLRELGQSHGLRPLLIDLREAPRIGGAAAEAAALVFAEYENCGCRITTLIGPDLILAARLHRLMSFHAPAHGRCFMSEDESFEWVGVGAPRVPAPAGGYPRPGFSPPQV